MFRSRPKEPVADCKDEKNAEADDGQPTTGIPLFTPPTDYSPLMYPSMDEAQSSKFTALKEYIKSVALPESDAYHSKEQAFLSDITFQRYLR